MWNDYDDEEYNEEVLDPMPAWYHLLPPQGRAWRDNEVLRGRNPDPYLEKQFIEAGTWKPTEAK